MLVCFTEISATNNQNKYFHNKYILFECFSFWDICLLYKITLNITSKIKTSVNEDEAIFNFFKLHPP